MRRPSLAVALSLAAAAAFAADPAATPFKATFLGENGGYKVSDAATDDYLVGRRAPPEAAAPAAPASRPVATKAGAHSRPPAGRQSLWNGRVQPLATAAPPAAGGTDLDAARADAASDYETRVLGARRGPARAALAPRPAPSSPAPAAAPVASSGRADAGKVFVSLALDPREAGSLRDAVAGLGAATGFSLDPRFEARPGPRGTVLYSGWIPAGRLGDALARPGVKSLRVETGGSPSRSSEAEGEFLIGLRLDDAARPGEGVDAGVRLLSSAAGFRLTRVVGLETAPDGRAVAVVAGVLPLSRLPRAMGLPQVAKVVPVGGDAPAAPPVDAGVAGFADFVARRGAWLVLLTAVLLLPGLRAPARRAAAVFTPYR